MCDAAITHARSTDGSSILSAEKLWACRTESLHSSGPCTVGNWPAPRQQQLASHQSLTTMISGATAVASAVTTIRRAVVLPIAAAVLLIVLPSISITVVSVVITVITVICIVAICHWSITSLAIRVVSKAAGWCIECCCLMCVGNGELMLNRLSVHCRQPQAASAAAVIRV